ncbi:acetate--CoA ligase family protein [Cryptosporangium sp. NPDC051539]|uniref:acetate--CoA ligase family protein n=1 Tax=Cryptosporangium sp. NPDC051539 TaxID=3363962 RepID=UPI00379FB9F6
MFYRQLLDPASVAVVGASGTPGKTTARPVEYLRRHGWDGALYPVNPSRDTVLGERAWPSLEALPEVPDHALIMTGADAAVEAVRECARIGVGVATVVADGFLPSTPAGRARATALRGILDSSKLRLLGTGSLGVANPRRRLALTGNAAFAEAVLPAGDVFVASQSGSVLGALLSRGSEMGLGFAGMVSTGAEMDLSLGEICLAAIDDPAVGSLALFLENLHAAADLEAAAEAAAKAGKPIVAYKLGRSAAAAELAVSHTGALAGDDAVADALFRDLGIARVTTLEALLEAQLLVRRVPPVPTRPRVCVVTTTGGGGAMVVDSLATRGATVVPPAPTTAERLAELGVTPDGGALIDLTLAGTRAELIRAVLEVVLAAPEFDAVIAVPGSSARFTPEVSVAPILACADAAKPLAVFVVPSAPEALAQLRARGVPAFRTPEACADAVLATFGRGRPVRRGAVPVRPGAAVTLDEDASATVLERAGLDVAPRTVVPATDVPSDLPVAGPAVVKVLSAELTHKSDVGGVVLGVTDGAGLARAAERITTATAAARPGFAAARLLVQQQVGGALAEVLIGLRRDPDVGPIVVLAAGGLLAEVYRDRSLRRAPVTVEEAAGMIGEVRALRLLAGYRGAPRGDLAALAAAVSAMSTLALDPSVVEAESNPVLVLANGVVAVDAVVTVVEDA